MGRYLTSTECIGFAVADRIARITLNRPEKRNAISGRLLGELRDALLEADALVEVNVIVLAGAGKDFCSGFDLTDIYAEHAADGEEAARAYRSHGATLDDDAWNVEAIQRQLATVFDIHKPVIARVQGNCVAGGTDLALMCDMVVAAEDARIGFPAARANGTPPNHMWYYHLGPQWAKRLLMTGDCLSGLDAARLGLVLDAVPAGELDAEVDELARRIAQVDGELLSAHKRIVNIAMELSGARTLQRLAAEMDARAHSSQGPRRRQFKADAAEQGIGKAVKNRDAPFGDGMARARWLSK